MSVITGNACGGGGGELMGWKKKKIRDGEERKSVEGVRNEDGLGKRRSVYFSSVRSELIRTESK